MYSYHCILQLVAVENVRGVVSMNETYELTVFTNSESVCNLYVSGLIIMYILLHIFIEHQFIFHLKLMVFYLILVV